MNSNEQIHSLLREKSYKKWLVIGIALWVILALLNSFLFTIVMGLVKLALALGGLGAIFYALWIVYPDLKKRYEEEIKKESN